MRQIRQEDRDICRMAHPNLFSLLRLEWSILLFSGVLLASAGLLFLTWQCTNQRLLRYNFSFIVPLLSFEYRHLPRRDFKYYFGLSHHKEAKTSGTLLDVV